MKYELLKDVFIKTLYRTLYHIRALKSFGKVREGVLGGYVESEKNLDQKGDCWIYGAGARVYGNAVISGNAKLRDNVRDYDDARVYGNATVRRSVMGYGNAGAYDQALVGGDSGVYGNAKVFGAAMVTRRSTVSGNDKVSGEVRVRDGNVSDSMEYSGTETISD